jgi:hypothetical protein
MYSAAEALSAVVNQMIMIGCVGDDFNADIAGLSLEMVVTTSTEFLTASSCQRVLLLLRLLCFAGRGF